MNVQDRANNIARKAVVATKTDRLRLPAEGQNERIEAECIAEIAALYEQRLTPQEVCFYAASETYRAIAAEADAVRLNSYLLELYEALDLAKAASTENAEDSRAALAQLAEQGRTLVSKAVEYGQSIAVKQKASVAGKKRQAKSALVKAFAIQKYESDSWKSTRQASIALWPVVQAEAWRIGQSMTPTQGPQTLYGWLLEHNKSTLSAG